MLSMLSFCTSRKTEDILFMFFLILKHYFSPSELKRIWDKVTSSAQLYLIYNECTDEAAKWRILCDHSKLSYAVSATTVIKTTGQVLLASKINARSSDTSNHTVVNIQKPSLDIK